MLRITLDDDSGSYSVELFKHDDTIQPVMDSFIRVLLAAGYSPETIGQYIESEYVKEAP